MKFTLVWHYKKVNKIIRSLAGGYYYDVPENSNDKSDKVTREIFYFLVKIGYANVRYIIQEGVLRADIKVRNPKFFTLSSMIRLYYLNLKYKKTIENVFGGVVIGIIVAYLSMKLGLVN